ncbi:phage head closure protein [uncultured Cohaesibacter sp.]|uniref:phage head closure protein n=1 Tax=uncultured Cohaesibacter sp. TaxID=1002546 RepID=UPI00292DD37A|nr:phage head closure protein [uncultured Cohaesibacter sp.]
MTQEGLETFLFDPANLRHRITLAEPVYDSDAPWNGVQSHNIVAEVWAGILQLEANERNDAEQASNSLTLRFVIRHRDDLSSITRLIYGGEPYDLLTLHDPDQRKNWLVVEAKGSLGHE